MGNVWESSGSLQGNMQQTHEGRTRRYTNCSSSSINSSVYAISSSSRKKSLVEKAIPSFFYPSSQNAVQDLYRTPTPPDSGRGSEMATLQVPSTRYHTPSLPPTRPSTPELVHSPYVDDNHIAGPSGAGECVLHPPNVIVIPPT